VSIASSVVKAAATKNHEDVLFKTGSPRGEAWRHLAESAASKKPGCSLQVPPPNDPPARPRQRNVLGRQPRCSLQAGGDDASDPVAAAAGDCGPRPRGDLAYTSSDSQDGVTPFTPTVADYFGVLGISLALAASIFVASPGLTFRPATHLIRTARRRLEGLLAIGTAARGQNHSLPGMF
jgi:hypothetical protein